MSKRTQKAAEDVDKLHKKYYKTGKLEIPTEEPGEEVKTETKTEVTETKIIGTETPVETSTDESIETVGSTEEKVIPVQEVKTPETPELQVSPEVLQPEISQTDLLKELQEKYEIEKRRYETLQGKYNAEVPRAFQEIKELKERLERTEEAKRIETKKQVEQEKVESQTQPLDASKYLSAEERSTWGDDFCDFVTKLARSVSEDTVTNKLSQVTPTTEYLDSMKDNDARVMIKVFEMEMASLVSDWLAINSEPGFVEWLKEPDSIGGDKTRFDSAQSHINNLDSAKLAKYFIAYKQQKANKSEKVKKVNEVPHQTPIQPIIQVQPTSQPQSSLSASANPISMTAKVNISPSKSHTVKQVIPTESHKVTIAELKEAGDKLKTNRISFEEFDKIRRKFMEDNYEALGGR